jgi:hypothetical protein
MLAYFLSATLYHPISPVLFPTFALKYHVPFRNKLRAGRRACFRSVWPRLFIYGAQP